MLYKYKATRDGAEYEGVKEAPDKVTLYREVKKEGGTIISTEEGGKRSFLKSLRWNAGISTDEKVAFAKNLAVMINAGIAIHRGLSIMAKQTSNGKLKSVLESLASSINKGKPLSEAMKDHSNVFSNLFIMMVHSGEESGKLTESLRIVAAQMERSSTLTKKVKGAMIYPVIIFCVMVILTVVLLVYMVPTLSETFKGLGVALPLPTRIIIWLSDFMRINFVIILVSAAAAAAAVGFFAKTRKGKRFFDFLNLHIPLISPIVKEVNSARTARTLSSLTSSGVDIVVAIGVTRDVLQNVFYKEVLEEAENKIQKGETISSVLTRASNLYPVFVGEMLAVGEETGQLSSMLENVADFYEKEVDEKTKNLSTIIEPLLMVFIGAAVGVFAIAMLLPTYSLVDVIQ